MPTTADLIKRYGAPDDLAEDGEIANLDRAEMADAALRTFAARTGQDGSGDLEFDAGSVISDLICDLLHLATARELDADEMLDNARGHFVAEVGLGYDD